MTELLDAVDELTKPIVNHFPQVSDSGKWLGAHTTQMPSLLEQLEAAIASSMSGRAGGGNPAARSVLNSDALFEFMKIKSQVRDWCHIEKVAPSRDVARDLRAWYAARLARETDDGFYIVQLRKWAGIIRTKLDPPTMIPLGPACVECGASRWVNDDGDEMPFPLVVQYAAGESDVLQNARAACRACGHTWEGAMQLRQLSYELDPKAPEESVEETTRV